MKFRLPLWLEIMLTVLLALAASNFATLLMFRGDIEEQLGRYGSDVMNQSVVSAANIVLRAPDALQRDIAVEVSSPGLMLSFDPTPLVATDAGRDVSSEIAIGSRLATAMPESVRVHELTVSELESLPERGMSAPSLPSHKKFVGVSIAARPGLWLNIRAWKYVARPPVRSFFLSGLAIIVSLILASMWLARRVTRPLQKLATAASLLRRGELTGTLSETGPAPVREAARAFNAMSSRVMTMLKSQRAIMAAVAHDLRTPISVLRFRAEMVGEEETRARLNETLDEMQAMTEAVLDATRFDGTGEATRAVEVATLADSLCVDMAELGGDVSFSGDSAITCTCRAAEVRRAVRNLIENALRYGRRARLSAEARDGFVSIHVDDEGPGIPLADLERVFEPFARLDESRSKETGGYGLGLSIARLIARGHGGDVELANRSGGGLRATLKLPLG